MPALARAAPAARLAYDDDSLTSALASHPHLRSARSYIMEDGVVYLALADKAYPKKLAFAYLLDVQREFVGELQREHGPQ